MLESLQPTAIIDYTLKHFKAHEFSNFMVELKCLFADIVMSPKASPPFILQPHVHTWMDQLSTFLPAIMRLEYTLGYHSDAVSVIMKGGEGLWVEYLAKILEALMAASGRPVEGLMQKAVGRLSKENKNAHEVASFTERLLGVTPEGLAACERIWDARSGLIDILGSTERAKRAGWVNWQSNQDILPTAVMEVIIAGWLQDDSMAETDKTVIIALALLLNLETYHYGIPKWKLTEATTYFEEQETKIIEEERRLDGLTKALKAKDPHGTKILLEQLGMEDVSPLDEELDTLPVAIAGAVEKCGGNEVEISFPLAEWTDLQRSGMGVGEAKTLLVRLFLDHLGDMPTSFCVHLDTDAQEIGMEHTPWTCLKDAKAPEQVYCVGKATPLTWQMSRIVYRHLKHSEPDIASLHTLVKRKMQDIVSLCPICGREHQAKNTQLRRPIPCSWISSCTRMWDNLPLDIRIPEFRTDTFAVDMLLTTVYAAAMSGRSELLPGCPIASSPIVMAILNTLPALNFLQSIPDLSKSLHSCHRDAEKLLIWALTHFRGFITTANGICKIPGLPVGTHQFILANASPTLEASFAAKLPKYKPTTTILFHGTSLDRLPSILTQGLRIHSGTSLQRTGAAHGKGIYMAEEPATSFSYSPSAVSWKNSGLNGMRLLLGCEVAGNGRSVSPGIHVIQDEKSVMVRYVFLIGSGAYAPSATHIVPAMRSAISALRSGAV
ncbi:hypothetical protein K458DRAFT_414308 [Lentithecium fluviatile CBS 122367]|uniref:Poly [ADP-ribose] polymerase n=1 Tax=Lentithecium fluviatile CBS 122367 TaxID=1168545 RepID=A0A6G1JDG6_9PLEO|nr:hypothetical protein K458DRAFT_414308 [Lentithecium fluviatile CBS 122367]